MGEKLGQGERFIPFTFNLTNGETLALPEGMKSRYLAILFYRGVW